MPIGAAVLIDGVVAGAGRNRRVQLGSAIRHGETVLGDFIRERPEIWNEDVGEE